MATRPSQRALDAFVITQLIDNGMDPIAKKINKLYVKLQRTKDDAAAQTRYAKRLQHYLSLACRLLAKQQSEMTGYIDTIEWDLKQGLLEGARQATTGKETVVSTDDEADGHVKRKDLFEEMVVLPPGRHVAAKVARSHELWILARVVTYNELTRTYEVEDVDNGDDDVSVEADPVSQAPSTSTRRHHFVPWDQVKPLPADTLKSDEWIHYRLNQHVMAIYPNTTSFYRGVVRVPNPKGATFVVVRFDDDADEFGSNAPDRKIPFRFVVDGS